MAKDSKNGNDSLKIVIVVGIIIVIALLISIIVILLNNHFGSKQEEEAPRNIVITEENVEQVYNEINEKESEGSTAPGYYTVTMNPTWHFKYGEDISYDAVVENVKKNTNDVYFDIVLESDESVVLYKSPIIPRGGKLKDIAFEEQLAVGTYPCVVIYNLIDDDQKTISTLRVTLTVVVEE